MTMRDDYLGMVNLYHATRKERDEARAIARDLVAIIRWSGMRSELAEKQKAKWRVLERFDALSWAKDEPSAYDFDCAGAPVRGDK